jgi:hypothetical protein
MRCDGPKAFLCVVLLEELFQARLVIDGGLLVGSSIRMALEYQALTARTALFTGLSGPPKKS